jgi:predicted phage terminase large subunit-like protein
MIAKLQVISPKQNFHEQDPLQAILRWDFASFVHQCFCSLNPGIRYLPNWHIDALAFALEQVRLGRIQRLIICMPPRSLKSIVTSVAFPAFVLGHDPAKRLITASYGAELAIKHASDFRAILRADWYRQLFPGTRISPAKNTETEVLTTARGYRLSTSIDGTLTGRGGGMIIVDDPLKPSDALSDSRRERVNEWYSNTLISRLDNKQTGAVIVVMQRLHLNDLVGMLLQSPEKWTVLNLPAIAEEEQRIQIRDDKYHVRRVGKLLHAEREPETVLDAIKAQLGSDTFSAQYQQRPVPPGGAMIKRHWPRRYEYVPPRSSSQVIQSWDTASKEGGQNDFSVCTSWMVHEKKHYLIDVLRGRFDYPTLRSRAIAHAQAHDPDTILVEDAGVGTALAVELRDAGLAAVPVKPERDKVTRMSVQSGKFEAGLVLFPRQAPWLADLEAELFSFPHSRHDDQVDSISQALGSNDSTYDASLRWVDG